MTQEKLVPNNGLVPKNFLSSQVVTNSSAALRDVLSTKSSDAYWLYNWKVVYWHDDLGRPICVLDEWVDVATFADLWGDYATDGTREILIYKWKIIKTWCNILFFEWEIPTKKWTQYKWLKIRPLNEILFFSNISAFKVLNLEEYDKKLISNLSVNYTDWSITFDLKTPDLDCCEILFIDSITQVSNFILIFNLSENSFTESISRLNKVHEKGTPFDLEKNLSRSSSPNDSSRSSNRSHRKRKSSWWWLDLADAVIVAGATWMFD